MIKGFGSFTGDSWIHKALMLQHCSAVHYPLEHSVCVYCIFLHRHLILIRCNISEWFLVPSLGFRKKSRRGFHSSADCCGAHLNVICCAHNVEPPRKPWATRLCVSMTATKRTWRMCQGLVQWRCLGLLFLFPLFVLWPEKNRGIDVCTVSHFP